MQKCTSSKVKETLGAYYQSNCIDLLESDSVWGPTWTCEESLPAQCSQAF